MKSKSFILLGCAVLALPGVAQEALLPEGGTGDAIPGTLAEPLLFSESSLPGRSDVAESAADAISLVDGERRRQGARWRMEPRLRLSGTYNDNIFIQPTNAVADYILTVSPGLAVGFWEDYDARERYFNRWETGAVAEGTRGSFLILDYMAGVLCYSRTHSQNTVNQNGHFDARWQGQKLTLGASLYAGSNQETSTDVGGLIEVKTLVGALTSSYALTGKTALGLSVHNTITEPAGYERTVEWRGEGFLDYAVSPIVRVGFGLAGGKLLVDPGYDQTFERILGRVGYSLSRKMEVDLSGGVEFRQSEEPGDRTNPVYDLRVRWTPVAGTRFGLTSYRRVAKSIYNAEDDIVQTGVALTFQREVLSGFEFSIRTGFEVSDYIGQVRTDDYVFVRPELSYGFAAWGSARVGYEFRRNNSTQSESEFRNNLVTVEIGFRY